MSRDSRIIHLYDRPYRRQSYSQHPVAPPDYGIGSAVLSCMAIAFFVGIFFWAYDAIAHRDTPFAPATATSAPRRPLSAANLVPPEAPAPDLHSPAVSLANADVPAPPTAPEAQPATTIEKATPAALAPPRKPRVRTVRKLPPEAAQAYASAPGFFRSPFGGF